MNILLPLSASAFLKDLKMLSRYSETDLPIKIVHRKKSRLIQSKGDKQWFFQQYFSGMISKTAINFAGGISGVHGSSFLGAGPNRQKQIWNRTEPNQIKQSKKFETRIGSNHQTINILAQKSIFSPFLAEKSSKMNRN